MRTLAALCLAFAPAALGQELVYFEENGGGGNPRGFYTLNAGTGGATLRTTVGGGERFFGLDIQPGSGDVYASAPVIGNTGFWKVDVDAGATTFLGFMGVEAIADITFQPGTGRLLGIERNSPYRLFEINTANGAPTPLGTLNEPVRCGMTFAPDGTLYAFSIGGVLSKITLSPLGATPVGGVPLPPGVIVEDAAVTAAGDLFFTLFTGEVYRVDVNNGNRTLVHTSGMGTGLLGLIEAPGASCYPDCNGDEVLNLADFGCFQTKFALGDPYADCNGDTILNLADFGCFQTRFALGCP